MRSKSFEANLRPECVVVEVTDDMVDRAAQVLLDSGIGYEAIHEGTAVLGDFDETARAMLTAALHCSLPQQEENRGA